MERIKTGLGFRREIADDFFGQSLLAPDFIELAPENWLGLGGYWGKVFRKAAEQYPITFHGLSLSIGSPEEPDWSFLKKVKQMIKDYDIHIYSEHLSFAKMDNAHLYDLLPLPFRLDAVKHIVNRVQQVQDFLGMQLTLENVSYYSPVAAEMSEAEFINEIVSQSGCGLLLDVNNVYVNANNHQYDALEFIDRMPLDKVNYIHMAGHLRISPDLIIDTHGEAIIDPVYELFDYTTSKMNPVPVLLERDFNFPAIDELALEMQKLRQISTKNLKKDVVFS